jgi:uncharacterized protein (DUF488 family)
VSVQLFTIGFAETSADSFFNLLRRSGAKRVVDVRLNNTSQLSGFTKKEDLRFFLREVCGMDYVHVPQLAPTSDILDAFKRHRGSWSAYEDAFKKLMFSRTVENAITPDLADLGCLLCSEKRPEQCHRRLVAEYLQEKWSGVVVTHLL